MLALGVSSTFFLGPAAPAGGLDYWLPLESERLLFRSAAIPAPAEEALYRDALDAYARRDVGRVIELLDGRSIPPAYAPLDLVLASALVGDGRLESALGLLERMDDFTLPQPWRDRALWLEFVALWRSGRPERAREILAVLAAAPGEFSGRARSELARP